MVNGVKKSNVRNLTKTFAAVSLLTPVGAYSLGVGDIKLHSALNQNLEAEIALVLSDTEKLEDIKVKLAPPSKFEEAGVPWSHFLSQIKFKTVTKANGAIVIKLSSKEVLREPFLDFLLEVSWPKGDVYREFTVLVDPPAVYQQKVIPVATKLAEKPSARSSKTANNERQSATSTASYSSIREYGPTSSRDTLWKVAEKLISDRDISVEQMMIALYEANPQAFYKPNVNALSAGAVLKVPEDEVVLRISSRQAKKEFSKQVKAWRGQLKIASKTKQKMAEVPQSKSQLQLRAPTEAEINNQVQVTPSVSESGQNLPESTTGIESFSQENQELKNRLDKLEDQLAKMQEMLEVKDEQLAALQSEKLQEKIKPAEPKIVPAEKPEKTEKVKETVTQKPKIKPKVAPKPAIQPEAETDWYNIILGTAGFGALGLLGWLWWRKRKAEEEISSESMFAASSQISLPETDQDLTIPVAEDKKDTSYDVGTVGESSFLSEFTPSDFDAFETDQAEVDPIAEADVYLAYGRYQQAEDLMRQAIENQPDRDECKLKLLEIFYANEDKKAFESYAAELESSGKKKDQEFWKKVSEMGIALFPGNQLFTAESEPEVEAASEEQADISDEDILQPDFSAPANEAEVDESEDDEGLEFDIASLSNVDKHNEESLDLTSELNNTDSNVIDFDLGESASDVQDSPITSTEEDSDVLDLSSDEELLADTPEELADFDFGDIEEKSDESVTAETEKENLELEVGTEDFNFQLDQGAPAPAAQNDSASDLATVSDITDMDEFETKIDLAKAYIDMGDAEAAKNIAEEVLENGSDTQKQEAKEIINQL